LTAYIDPILLDGKPYHGSCGYSVTYHQGDLGSNPGHSVLDLWWIK